MTRRVHTGQLMTDKHCLGVSVTGCGGSSAAHEDSRYGGRERLTMVTTTVVVIVVVVTSIAWTQVAHTHTSSPGNTTTLSQVFKIPLLFDFFSLSHFTNLVHRQLKRFSFLCLLFILLHHRRFIPSGFLFLLVLLLLLLLESYRSHETFSTQNHLAVPRTIADT